ncbi:MAG: S8 family serine peptidase [Alphaproteobacteria bacterium]|nr:S8 family serine peptidase [Alphaproteobacteria bacterium]
MNTTFLLLGLLKAPAWAGPGTALVGVEPGAWAHLHPAAEAMGGHAQGCFHAAGVCALHFDGDPPLEVLGALPGVRYVEADALMDLAPGPVLLPDPGASGAAPPSDAQGTADCPDLWELTLLDAEGLWQTASGADAPVVAIQDSGFLTSHVELSGRIAGGYDYGDGDDTPEVSWSAGVPGHGTFIAGLIAAVPDNNVGRAGLAPDAQLNLQKIADRTGALYFSYAVDAMADLAEGDLGVGVLSYSIASSSTIQSFDDAIDALGDADILMVAAAGNCGTADCADGDNDRFPLYPANHAGDHVLSVAGSTRDDDFNPYSHYGRSTVDLAAPGVDICSLGVGNDRAFTTAAGTSYAAPLVAAAAALVRGEHPGLTAVETARIMRASALDTAGLADRVRSGGRLDPQAALNTALPRLTEPAPLSFDGEGTLGLQVGNPGAEGQGLLLIFHDPALELTPLEGWTGTTLGPGARFTLPDAGTITLADTATILDGTLARHSAETLVVRVRGLAEGSFPMQVRLVASSAGADYLNAPYDQGEADPTGFLAWTVDVRVTEAWGEPVDTSPPSDSDVDTDAPPDDTDASTDDSGPPVNPPGGGRCGCGGGSGGGFALALAAAALLRRRRG